MVTIILLLLTLTLQSVEIKQGSTCKTMQPAYFTKEGT